jgi:hypothetical protein
MNDQAILTVLAYLNRDKINLMPYDSYMGKKFLDWHHRKNTQHAEINRAYNSLLPQYATETKSSKFTRWVYNNALSRMLRKMILESAKEEYKQAN